TASCTTGCMACNVAGHKGDCYPVPMGSDPHNVCSADLANCKGDNCLGDGTCNLPDTTTCAGSTCSGTTLTTHACMGGTCAAGMSTCSGNLVCNPAMTSCLPQCNADTDCASGYWCNM